MRSTAGIFIKRQGNRMGNRKSPDGWVSLDNSAKIYPAVRTRDWAAMFRVSVTLKDEVDQGLLERALADTLKRIPAFCLSRQRGVLVLSGTEPSPSLVEPDVNNPCKKIDKRESNGCYFRVRVYRSRIALELFHSISDGNGAMVFLKTLAARYLTLSGHPIPAGEGVLDAQRSPIPKKWRTAMRHTHPSATSRAAGKKRRTIPA